MANICDQNLYIVASTDDDMRDLLTVMAENFEKVTKIDLLASVSAFAGWREYARAMSAGSTNSK